MRWVCLLAGLVLVRSLLADERPTGEATPANESVLGQVFLDEPELTESSGLAFSLRQPNRLWSHNDSGDGPRLWCFDNTTGERTGSCRLKSAVAVDWEAMTSVPNPVGDETTKPMLVVADCGDNQRRRAYVTLYQFDEPDPNADVVLDRDQWRSLKVRFPSGPVDCEAMWFDEAEKTFVFLAKSVSPLVGVYSLRASAFKETQTDAIVTCTRMATLAVPLATGGDRDSRTGDIWISTYWNAFCFKRNEQGTLQSQLMQTPTAHPMPAWKQIESIAVDERSRVWISSEGTPAKLGMLH